MLRINRGKILIKEGQKLCLWLAFIAGCLCLTAIILYVGIEHTYQSHKILMSVIRVCQFIFLFNVLYGLIFLFKQSLHYNRRLKWIMDFFLVLTIVPLLLSSHGNIPIFPENILNSKLFLFIVLGLYSVFEISYGILRLLGKKTNPSLILAGSFAFFILIGTLVLMLPKCTTGGISFTDALFVATSAVSITGLCPVDIAVVLTPTGLAVLAVLIQIGALGVLTFTSFFALFFSGETSIFNQLMVRDLMYSKTANSLLPTLLYIFIFTLVIEIAGAIAIYFSLPHDFPISDEWGKIIFSGFQSLSAFCNAGFTWLEGGMGNVTLMHSNQSIYVVMGTLVILGGIGFPILVNMKNILKNHLRSILQFIRILPQRAHRIKHLYDINTKIVLYTSLIITAVTIALFLWLEWNNSLDGMTLWQKIAQSYFNASVPRSSGFSSVNPAGFLPSTLLLMMLLMWIGGSSQSTAGGIKVNTFAAMLMNLKSLITGKKYITAFGRTISFMSVRRANAVIALSIISYFLLTFIIVIIEPELQVKDLAFESASALFTVGSSLGITAALCPASKIILCVAMFVGRVGLLSLLMGMAKDVYEKKPIYPYDNIIIN